MHSQARANEVMSRNPAYFSAGLTFRTSLVFPMRRRKIRRALAR